MKTRNLAVLLALTFLLGVHDGYIALWRSGEPEPAEVFPYRVEYLPEADRKMLEEGIKITSMKQLNQFMEDYLS